MASQRAFLRSLAQLGDRPPEDVGGKAAGLARLAAAGLPVPAGFVIPTGAHLDGDLAAELDRAAEELMRDSPEPKAARLVVRSSATCEDTAAAGAPGVFLSVRDVLPGPPLHEAVRAVQGSLHSPTATAYLARSGAAAGGAAMAVIIQLQSPGTLATVYTRPPGDPTAPHLLLEVAERLALVDRATLAVAAGRVELAAGEIAEVARLALAAEGVIGGPADVEVVIGAGRSDGAANVAVVQARPIPAGRRADPRDGEFATAAAALADARLWSWDATHNPDPLSPAQAGLVELVDEARAAASDQRVVCGYLYTSPRPDVDADIEPAELRRVYETELRPAMERALATLDGRPDLDRALAAYVEFYRIYALRLAPAISRARRGLAAEWIHAVGSPLAALPEGERRRAAAALSPSWDVATPTYGETPDLLARVLAGDHGSPAAAGRGGSYHTPLTSLAQDLALLAEEDDLLFARAQAGVRRALIAVADRWLTPVDDVMHLPLALALAAAPPSDLAPRAAAARAERDRWRSYVPPLHIQGGQTIRDPHEGTAAVIRGLPASPGRARGRIERDPAAAGGMALAVQAIIPGLAPLLAARPPVAVLAERGGLLGHGAALARSLGVPSVIAPGIRDLPSGAEVLVDGDLGLVIRL